MFLKTAIDTLQESVPRDCAAFLPELVLCAGIVVLLLLRLISALDRWHLGWLALGFTAIALAAAAYQWLGVFEWLPTPEQFRGEAKSSDFFSGMLVYDYFTIFLRLFLLTFAVLLIWLSLLTGIPDREDSADFYTLILGATLGMSVMASTNHLLMMF